MSYLNLADLKGEHVLQPGQVVVVSHQAGSYTMSGRGVVAVHEPGETPVLVNYQHSSTRVGIITEADQVFLIPTPAIVRQWNVIRCVWPLGTKRPSEPRRA